VTSDSNYLINFSLKFFAIKILIDDPETGFHGGSSNNNKNKIIFLAVSSNTQKIDFVICKMGYQASSSLGIDGDKLN